MINSFSASLKDKDIIEVAVTKAYTSNTIESFKLYENGVYIKKLAIISKFLFYTHHSNNIIIVCY